MILRRLLNDAVRKWPITSLTYRFYNYPSRALSPTDVASVIERAFKVFQFCFFSFSLIFRLLQYNVDTAGRRVAAYPCCEVTIIIYISTVVKVVL